MSDPALKRQKVLRETTTAKSSASADLRKSSAEQAAGSGTEQRRHMPLEMLEARDRDMVGEQLPLIRV